MRIGSAALAISSLGIALFLASACGSDSTPSTTNEDELEELRARIASTYDAGPLEALLSEALAIAAANPGTELGTGAFALAEATVLERYSGHDAGPFSENIPAPDAQIADTYVQDFRNLAAFAAVVRPPYIPSATRDRFHAELMERADRTLRDLEWARNNRVHWATDLANDGTTEGTWFALVAMLDGGMGASMGTLDSEDYAREHAALLYVRDLAVRVGEPPGVVDAWDLLIQAVVIANFEPPNIDTRYEDGKFITRYTEEAVASATENASQLSAAIDSARAFFPPIPD